MEELQSKHRKEQRDLQSQITQKKKQASKKTRKGVNDECDRLETDLKARQAAEVATFHGEPAENANEVSAEALDELTLRVDGDDDKAQTNDTQHVSEPDTGRTELHDEVLSMQGKRPSRQKARLARRAAEQEDQARQAAEEAKNLPDRKQQEHERMLEIIKKRGLQEKEIRADGHCLYSAIADQLDQLQIPLGSSPGEKPATGYKAVRNAAADYIEQHRDDFVPFLEEPLPEYLLKIRETGEWGGQLELMALAKTYGTDINVLQDFGRVEKIESGGNGERGTMWLGYYKHGFGLGEHYNSLRKGG